MYLGFLKPNRANIIGTALLIMANYAAGVVSGFMARFLMAGSSDSGMAQSMGREFSRGAGSFTGGGGEFAVGGIQTLGLASQALNLLVLAILFYLVLSFILGKLAGKPKDGGEAAKKK
ncbi:MAG: hypothetical protein ACP5NX_02585 [Candidatus Bilamarchaeaceae archaeon]